MKTAYFNGYVYTGDWPLQEAFLVEDGVFTKTGPNAGILGSLAPGDAKVDLDGRCVGAGIIDSHKWSGIAVLKAETWADTDTPVGVGMRGVPLSGGGIDVIEGRAAFRVGGA